MPPIYINYFYDVILKKKEKEVGQIFFNKLLLYAEELGLFLKQHETEEELNKAFGYEGDNRAAAVYQFNVLCLHDKKHAKENELPKIHYDKGTSCYTFAHEIGHHLLAICERQQSEEAADKMVYALAKTFLTEEQIKYIGIPLSVRNGEDIEEIKSFGFYELMEKHYKEEKFMDKLFCKRICKKRIAEDKLSPTF